MTEAIENAERRMEYVFKVQKLLAKAERAGTQEEADAFYAKATELIAKWRIDDLELKNNGDEMTTVVMPLGTYSPVADVLALQSVMKAFEVRVAFSAYRGSGTKPEAHLFGWSSDIAKAQLMWSSISVQLAGACRREEPKGLDRNQQRVWRQSFKRGYGDTIGKRLKTAMTTTVAEAVAKTPGVGLVLVSRQDQLEKFYGQHTGRSRSHSMHTDHRAMQSGREAGHRADLGQARVSGRGKELTR